MSKKELEVKEQEPVTTSIAEISLKDMALQEIGKVSAGIAELAAKYAGQVYQVTTTKGMEEAKAARLDIREKRYKIPHIVKEKKQALKKIGDDIQAEGDRITGILFELETPIDEQIKAEEERKAAIKAEKERIEKERVDGIRARIDKLRNLPVVALGAENAADLELFIAKVEASAIGVEFQEFKEEAEAAKVEAVGKLKDMLTLKQQQEAEAAQAEADRKENERKAELQGRVDAIKRVAIDATSVQCWDELEAQIKHLGATDLSGMQEYEEAAVEAIKKATADIRAMIDQKKAAKKLADDQEAFQRQQDEAAEKQRLKDEADQKERQRVEVIKNMITGIVRWPSKCIGLSALNIRSEIKNSEMDIPCKEEDFHEFAAEAEAERIIALGTMTNMAEAAEKSEKDAADLKRQQDELAAAQKKIDDEAREKQEKEVAEQAEKEAAVAVTEEPKTPADDPRETEVVTITRKEYDDLLQDSLILSALRGAGVDNWDGWDFAMKALEDEA